ncbi:hypothetical protein [Actinoplanes sp. NPDC051411]|uniref:hypothetical protein n=1 Tax=Actinoplanes sp. NPDC051411 TaxID=3155522 RepID=UPI003438D421
MTARDDADLARLSRLDPARPDAAPAPGSLRYDLILEKAMTQTISPPLPSRPAARRGLTWRSAVLTGAVAVTLAAAATAGVLATRPGSASAAVLTAATRTGEVTSLRTVDESVDAGGGHSTTRAEFSGDDLKLVSQDSIGTDELTVVGGYAWENKTEQGRTENSGKQKLTPQSRLAPFAESTEHVIRAALQDANVKRLGTTEIRGSKATHYRLDLTDVSRAALTALPEAELAWFDLDSVHRSATVDIWIADDLIQRIVVHVPDYMQSTIDFYDFNAPVSITAPTK